MSIPKQPSFTGKWYHPEQLGYIREHDKCTYLVEVWRAPDGTVKEWDATKGQPKLFVDDNVGIR
jgi:hypothetical protein